MASGTTAWCSNAAMDAEHRLTAEPLAKLTLQGDFSLLWAKAGGAGGHFWHDTVTETNIITPAK
ncbi:hypothetical protein, partial [Accumulibacter sp.]|uniref:hypothetical protein n=1 Tax=Accumulibacter sp. TaxID=2053492 RepID=UPI001ACCD827